MFTKVRRQANNLPNREPDMKAWGAMYWFKEMVGLVQLDDPLMTPSGPQMLYLGCCPSGTLLARPRGYMAWKEVPPEVEKAFQEWKKQEAESILVGE